MDNIMDKIIALGLALIITLATVATVEALSIDTQKNIELILTK